MKTMRAIVESAKPAPSAAQRALLCGAVGEALTREEQEIFLEATGQEAKPGFRSQISAACGRQSGKTDVVAACFVRYAVHNAAECGVDMKRPATILIVSNTIRNQSKKTFDSIRRALIDDEELPAITRNLEDNPALLEFGTIGVTVRVVQNSPRAVRGFSCFFLVMEECDHWIDEGISNFDAVYDAIEPTLATFDRARVLKISSPAGPGSPLHDDYERRFADADLLFWQLSSEKMNPAISQFRLLAARARGGKKFSREYEAQFEGGSEGLYTLELCRAASYENERISPEEFPAFVEMLKKEHPDLPAAKLVLSFDLGGIADPCAFAISAGYRQADDETGSERASSILLHVEQQKPPVDIDSFVDHAFHVARKYGCQFVTSDMVERRLVESYATRLKMRYVKRTTLGNAEEVVESYYLVQRQMQKGRCMICNLPDLHTQMTRLRDFPAKGITTQGNKKDDMAVASIQSIAESTTGEYVREFWFATL